MNDSCDSNEEPAAMDQDRCAEETRVGQPNLALRVEFIGLLQHKGLVGCSGGRGSRGDSTAAALAVALVLVLGFSSASACGQRGGRVLHVVRCGACLLLLLGEHVDAHAGHAVLDDGQAVVLERHRTRALELLQRSRRGGCSGHGSGSG